MKLVDFYSDERLCNLRDLMGAPLPSESFQETTLSFSPLTIDEQRHLETVGIEGSLGDLNVESDGTLSLKGQRVAVYIRDVGIYKHNFKLPKYHISYCKSLKEKSEKNQFNLKYVFYQNDSGLFPVNLINGRQVDSRVERLDVCMNCLDTIQWKGFSLSPEQKALRREVVDAFTLKEFYQEYPKDLLSVKPAHSAYTSPLNDYSSDWSIVRKRIIEVRGNKCEKCGESRADRLDVHHKNSVKNDNTQSNLEVLCVKCHGEEHSHYQDTPRYKSKSS